MEHTTIRRGRWAALSVVSVAALSAALLTPSAASAATPLSGTVTYNGAAATGVEVDFYRLDPSDGTWHYKDDADALTDASGHWSYTGTLNQDGQYATFYYTDSSNAIYASDQGRNGQTKLDNLVSEFNVTGGVASTATVPTETLAINSGAVQYSVKDATTGAALVDPAVTSGYGNVGDGIGADGNYLPSAYGGSTGTFNGTFVVGGALPGTYYSGSADAQNYQESYLRAPVTVVLGQTTVVPAIGLYPNGTPSVDTVLTLPRTVKVTGSPKVGALLTAAIPATSATATYQWYTGELPIAGATAQTFVPTAAQRGNVVSVRVLFTAPNYVDDIFYSQPSDIVQIGDPNQAVVKVTGTAKFGKTLTATIAGSTVADARSIYQWYRNGAPIGGQVGATYTVTKADVGQKVFASITSFSQGHTDAVLPSNIVGVAHDKATVAFSAKTSISKSTKLKVKINLKDGATKNAATGTIKVYYTSKKFKTATFTTKSTTKTVTLPKLSKGKHTIKIKYAGDTHYLAKSTSFKVTVK